LFLQKFIVDCLRKNKVLSIMFRVFLWIRRWKKRI